MPSSGTVISNVFGAQTGPIPLSQLDTNFATAVLASNTLLNFSNYFVDSSGAANSVTVAVPSPLVFSYVAGVGLQVKIANTNSSATVNVNVNSLGNKLIINNDGTSLVVGQIPVNSIISLIYDGANFRLQSQSKNGLFPDGSVGSPSISFALDTDTGIYRVGANSMGFTAGGTLRFTADSSIGLTMAAGNQLRVVDGSAASPGLIFTTETNTGLYRFGVNAIGISTAGTTAVIIDSAQRFGLIDGTAASPAYQFISDSNTGIFRGGADDLRISVGGVTDVIFDSNGLALQLGHLYVPDGTAALPVFSFGSDPNTGVYRSGTDTIGLSCNGALKAAINGSGIFQFSSGASTTPSITFLADTGVGLYYNVSETSLGVTIGGSSAIQINGTSTTGARTATFSATNKPGLGTAGPISWLPVLTAGGVQGYIPIFGA